MFTAQPFCYTVGPAAHTVGAVELDIAHAFREGITDGHVALLIRRVGFAHIR